MTTTLTNVERFIIRSSGGIPGTQWKDYEVYFDVFIFNMTFLKGYALGKKKGEN